MAIKNDQKNEKEDSRLLQEMIKCEFYNLEDSKLKKMSTPMNKYKAIWISRDIDRFSNKKIIRTVDIDGLSIKNENFAILGKCFGVAVVMEEIDETN